VYRVFGSGKFRFFDLRFLHSSLTSCLVILSFRFHTGSMHGPYAMFQKQARTFNGGKKIGLIRAADTRMAGYFYAFHRMLRLKPALEATVASVEFQGLGLQKPVVVKAVAFINDREMWNALHVVTRCLFPALRVLRLADRSEPGFDSLYYFIRKCEKAMEWSAHAFANLNYFTNSIRNPMNLQDIMDNVVRKEPLDDDDEFDDMVAEGHDEDGEGLSDDDNVPELHVGSGTGKDFGKHIRTIWNKRKTQMVSDFCIAGWLLSPLEEVVMDVRSARTSAHNDAMDRILGKLYHFLMDNELDKLKDTFWTEFDEFNSKSGRFGGGRKYIWNSDLIRRRHSAKWHAQYSVQWTEVRLFVVLLFLFFRGY
jgi:hypothetical protein